MNKPSACGFAVTFIVDSSVSAFLSLRAERQTRRPTGLEDEQAERTEGGHDSRPRLVGKAIAMARSCSILEGYAANACQLVECSIDLLNVRLCALVGPCVEFRAVPRDGSHHTHQVHRIFSDATGSRKEE